MTVSPLCLTCKHFHNDRAVITTCDAFPEGIPMDILLTFIDHTKPLAGDHGLQYEREGEPVGGVPVPTLVPGE